MPTWFQSITYKKIRRVTRISTFIENNRQLHYPTIFISISRIKRLFKAKQECNKRIPTSVLSIKLNL